LPYLAGITGASPDEASWILTAFNAAYYAMILFSPWMMARVGRKRLMLGALVGFVAVSALLAVTTDYHAFVLLRFAQGLFWDAFTCPQRCCSSRPYRPSRSAMRRRFSC